jgi:hypothetical protein
MAIEKNARVVRTSNGFQSVAHTLWMIEADVMDCFDNGAEPLNAYLDQQAKMNRELAKLSKMAKEIVK